MLPANSRLYYREEAKGKAQAFKATLRKEAADKAAVRDLEKKRAAAGSHYVEALDDVTPDAQVTSRPGELSGLWFATPRGGEWAAGFAPGASALLLQC